MDYLIPSNAKKSLLIFGMFTKFDLILFGSGIVTTIILLLFISPSTFWGAIIDLLPALITGFLVLPIPNYHNTLTVIKNVYNFYTDIHGQKYIWKGWCVKDEFKETNKK